MKPTGIFSAIKTTLGGLSTQIKRMDLISQNIANAEKAPDQDGKVYQRKQLISQGDAREKQQTRFSDRMRLQMRSSSKGHMESQATTKSGPDAPQSKPYKVVEQEGAKMVYEPTHPQADENGFVKLPDINPVEEMIDLISASRTYEANITVLNAAKQMAKRAMQI